MSATGNPTFKNKAEKLEHIRDEIIQESKTNNQREKNITLISSLVKYDTPFLVSSTISNKKTLEDLEENEENAQLFLRNIINRGGTGEREDEIRDYSVKDALNKILPPKKITENEQIWVQYASCTPVTKAEVVTLQEGLDRKLQTQQARETGICPIREQLYNECFDELIRQVTINCLERGILMMLVKTEYENQIKTYQNLYQSSIAYGIRSYLIIEEEKKRMNDENEQMEEECDELSSDIEALKKEIEELKIKDEEQRQELNEKHRQFLSLNTESIELLKNEIRNKWEIWTKQQNA